MTRRGEIISGVVVFMFLLWSGGYHGWAALLGMAGVMAWGMDASIFHTVRCWCKNGWVESPLSDAMRPHAACGASGRRRRFAQRLLNRQRKS